MYGEGPKCARRIKVLLYQVVCYRYRRQVEGTNSALIYSRGGMLPPECIYKYTFRSVIEQIQSHSRQAKTANGVSTYRRGGVCPPDTIPKGVLVDVFGRPDVAPTVDAFLSLTAMRFNLSLQADVVRSLRAVKIYLLEPSVTNFFFGGEIFE